MFCRIDVGYSSRIGLYLARQIEAVLVSLSCISCDRDDAMDQFWLNPQTRENVR